MKVGILTFHHVTNYGAALQVYALWYYLNCLEIDVEIIDYRSRKAMKTYSQYLFGLWAPGKLKRGELVRNVVHLAKMRWFLNKHLKLSPRTVYDRERLKHFADKYDLVICGSDEICNINSTWGFDSAFFLDFVDKTKTKKSSYAASFGFTSSLEKNEAQSISEFLQDFSHVSVRDSNSQQIVNEIYTGEVSKVLDPTFLIQEHYHKLIKPLNLKRRYVLIYFHKKAQKYESEIIHYLAQKLDLEIISIGISYGTNVEIANKKILHAEPVEWLSWFKNADFIFTDSYHGMIFSVIFQKQFWVVSRKDKNIKINDLLVDIKLEERILNINNLGDGESSEQLDALLEPVDYSQSFQILNQKLKQSTQFLSSLLQ